jgi:hypothetical protein
METGKRRRLDTAALRPWIGRIAAAIAVVTVLAIAAYVGATRHPTASPPARAEAESEITAALSIPAEADDVLAGDFLIERFYTVEADSGQRYVADLCKGRIKDVSVAPRADLAGYAYTLVLDRTGLPPESDRLSAYVAQMQPLPADASVTYLGLRVQDGPSENFPVNYDGSLPRRHHAFRGPEGEGVFEFLAGQSFADVSLGPQLIGVKRTHYLLSNTAHFPYFAAIFKLNRAIFVSELLIVDGTSAGQRRLYEEVSRKVPARP